MDLFLVVVEDHHTDIDITIFRHRENALKYCIEIIEEYNYDRTEDELEDDRDVMDSSGWLFYRTLSCEGDCVFLEEHELGEE